MPQVSTVSEEENCNSSQEGHWKTAERLDKNLGHSTESNVATYGFSYLMLPSF